MIEMNLEQANSRDNLFLPVSNVMLAEVMAEARQLAHRFPGILERITGDQDRTGQRRRGCGASSRRGCGGRLSHCPGWTAWSRRKS